MKQSLDNDYAEQVKQIRLKLGMTQVELAQALGVSFPTVNRWENNKSRPSRLSWKHLKELSEKEGALSVREEEKEAVSDSTPPPIDFTADPKLLKVLAEGERLSFGHLANPAFATEISSIDPLPHQRIAVYDHMLQQARLRFLLADDAGAGKTIMTGLYIREMLFRRLLKRILIVPPAGLIGNWQRELQVLFNLPFKIVEGSDAASENPFVGPESDRLIVSVDTLSGDKMFQRLAEPDVEAYDLVVFDEAHKLSCDRGGDFRVRKTIRYKLAEALAGVPERNQDFQLSWSAYHLLLLTATPHMGKEYPYFALWRLLDPDVFTTPEAFEDFPATRRDRLFIRRTKEEMVRLDGTPLYPTRTSNTLGYALTQGEDSEQQLYEATTEYFRTVYNNIKTLNQSAAQLVIGVFQRRLASSTYALLCSFERRFEKLCRIIDQINSGEKTMIDFIKSQKQIREEDDVFACMSADEEGMEGDKETNEIGEEKLLATLIASTLADLQFERDQLEKLCHLAKKIYQSGRESKFEKLQEIVLDDTYAREKLIVFTEHRDTLDFLSLRLGGMGYTNQIAQIHGGMPYTERQEAIERFRKPVEEGGARFMLCTDAAAEGVNMQFCWIMINYDIPWNPARLEQRMGRIHRYGQKHDPVVILNLVAPETREGRVLKTLLDKLEKIRKQLKSDKVFDSIGRVFSGVSIKDFMDRIAAGADPGQVAEELDGTLTTEQINAIVMQERTLYGAGGDVKKELPRLQNSIEHEIYFRLLPGYIRSYLSSAVPYMDLKIEGDLGGYFTLEPEKQTAMDPLRSALKSYSSTQASHFSIVRPDDLNTAIWMHPGEPLFDTFRHLVQQKIGKKALQGARFIDPTAEKPYFFHLARLTVIRRADPELPQLAKEEVVECRLVGLKQNESDEIVPCPVEHLLLLHGSDGISPAAIRLATEASRHIAHARAYLTERTCRALAAQCREKLQSVLPERESLVKRGYSYRESELAEARTKLSKKVMSGDSQSAWQLEEVKQRQRQLHEMRTLALDTLRREPELIIPGNVEFIAHALIMPTDDPDALEQRDKNVEEIAMEFTKAYEEAQGATVKFVHTPKLAKAAGLPEHPGFDLLSIRPDKSERCIEVKGRAEEGEVELTDNEWSRACNLRNDYWLYAVYQCASPAPQLIRVQDPFGTLLVRPVTTTQTVERTIQATIEKKGYRIGYSQIMEAGKL